MEVGCNTPVEIKAHHIILPPDETLARLFLYRDTVSEIYYLWCIINISIRVLKQDFEKPSDFSRYFFIQIFTIFFIIIFKSRLKFDIDEM